MSSPISRKRIPLWKIFSSLFLLLVLLAFFWPHPLINQIKASGTAVLVKLGINDPLRYQIHMILAGLASKANYPKIASEQFRKAEPHARDNSQRVGALTGYGESLVGFGQWQEAEKVFRSVTLLDPDNPRANGVLKDLQNRKQ